MSFFKDGDGAQQSHAAAGDNSLFNRGLGGMQGILYPGLFLFHGHLGGGADIDHRHAAGQLGQAFLQLLAVVVQVVSSIC